MTNVVEVRNLTKSYGDFKALDSVSFALREDKIYGLLGRNGAGKTTIMHLLTAQQFPSGGEVNLFGENPYENNRVLTRTCFIKESQKYPDTFTVRDVMSVAAILFGNWDREYASRLIEDFRLPLKRRVKKLSRGMQSSVGIVVGLASRAPLTIFDEPYLGLDAVARSLFYEHLIEDYGKFPRTVILSTHLIDEVSLMLEHVLLIDKGKLMIDEDAEALRGSAYTVTGAAAKVERFSKDKQIIRKESFGGLLSVTIVGQSSESEQEEARASGLETAPVSLQQLIVHLTKTESSQEKEGERI